MLFNLNILGVYFKTIYKQLLDEHETNEERFQIIHLAGQFHFILDLIGKSLTLKNISAD